MEGNKNRFSTFYRSLIAAGALAAAAFCVSPCNAQQQQYANAYAYWAFGDNVNDVVNVDQKIWVAKLASESQWVMMWSWTADPAHGGYFGFNTDYEGKAQALFSLWNADRATGANCKEFGGEGVGWSCRMPFDLRSDVVYQLRLARTKTDAEGVWWGGWIYEGAASANQKEYFLGEIRVKKEMNRIVGNSIMNFSEFYGIEVERCSNVPLSIFVVAPPLANRDEKGSSYRYNARRNGGTKPRSNPCQSGNEPQGNLLKVENYDLAGTAASLIFIGGTHSDHVVPKGMTPPQALKGAAGYVDGSPKPALPANASQAPKPEVSANTHPAPKRGSGVKSRYSVAELTIFERMAGDVLVLDLEGKLTDAGGNAALRDAIRGALQDGKTKILVAMLRVTSGDNGSPAELIASHTAANAKNSKLKLSNIPDFFVDLPMITELLTAFQTYDSEADALASF